MDSFDVRHSSPLILLFFLAIKHLTHWIQSIHIDTVGCERGNVGLSQVVGVKEVLEEEPTGLYDGFYVKTK